VDDCGLLILTGLVQALEDVPDVVRGPVLQMVQQSEQKLGRLR